MAKSITPTREMYLKVILNLQEKEGSVKTYDIAGALNVKPGTVTSTISSLEREGLLIHVPYRGVRLTEKGEALAKDVVRRHRLWERLLVDVLKIPWSRVHDLACMLEHTVDGDVADAIDSLLKHPQTCPHGNPLPDKKRSAREREIEALADLPSKSAALIVKVVDERAALLQYFAKLGLTPGTRVEVEEKAPFNGPIIVRVGGASYALGLQAASAVYVKRA